MVLQADWAGVMEVGYFILWVRGVHIAINALSRFFFIEYFYEIMDTSRVENAKFAFCFK